MKVLNLCTNSAVTSYDIKFAVNMCLLNMTDETSLGKMVRRMLEWETMRDKFASVHDDLKQLGITGVEVEEQGLYFVGYKQGNNMNSSWNSHF